MCLAILYQLELLLTASYRKPNRLGGVFSHVAGSLEGSSAVLRPLNALLLHWLWLQSSCEEMAAVPPTITFTFQEGIRG